MPTSSEAEEAPQGPLSPEAYRAAVETLAQLGAIERHEHEWPCPECFNLMTPAKPTEHDEGRWVFACTECGGKWCNYAPTYDGWTPPRWRRARNPKPLLGKVWPSACR